MTERPINFTAIEVRGVLAGTMTQFRRPMRGVPPSAEGPFEAAMAPGSGPKFNQWAMRFDGTMNKVRCPFGRVGDRLWVRETFASCNWAGIHLPVPRANKEVGTVAYRADGDNEGFGLSWRPSIHMPRWASRITPEVTDVRVQRVQEISKDDCIAEGMPALEDVHAGWHQSFSALYDSIHGPGAFERNEWVWAISFRMAQP